MLVDNLQRGNTRYFGNMLSEIGNPRPYIAVLQQFISTVPYRTLTHAIAIVGKAIRFGCIAAFQIFITELFLFKSEFLGHTPKLQQIQRQKSAILHLLFLENICCFKNNYYLCSVIKNQNQAAGLKNGKIMKQIFSVRNTRPTVESNEIFASENEQEARAFFEDEKKRLSANEPVNISGWMDNDTAWPRVYCIELCRIMVDEEDGYVENMETLDETEYYWM